MSGFSIQDPYPPPANVIEAGNPFPLAFDLDPDLYDDDDYRELLSEFQTLDPATTKRDLADATMAIQEDNWRVWSKSEFYVPRSPCLTHIVI